MAFGSRKITVEVVGDTRSLERSFGRASSSASHFNRDISRSARGALAATLSFRGLGRALAFGTAPFLGGAGIAAALKSTVGAAEENQRVLALTGNTVRRVGLNWGIYAAQVKRAALEQAKVSGFDDEAILTSFSTLIQRTKNVKEALKETALAQNLARAKNLALETSTRLVIKAAAGMGAGLRRVGIIVPKTARGIELLSILQERFGGAAVKFGKTAVGAQDRFRVALENTQETIGGQALPGITRYLNKASDWLNQSKNQQKIEQALKTAVRDTAEVIRDAAGVVRKITGAVGGWKNALKIVLALKVASIIGGWVIPIAKAAKVMRGLAFAEKAVAGAQTTVATSTVVERIAAYGFAADKSAGKLTKLRAVLKNLATAAGVPIVFTIVRKFLPFSAFRDQPPMDDAFKRFARERGIDPATGRALSRRAVPSPLSFPQPGFLSSSLRPDDRAGPRGPEAQQAAFDPRFDVPKSTVSRVERIRRLREWFDTFIDRRLGRVQDAPLKAQVAALGKIAAAIRQQIAKTRDVTRLATLQDKLLEVRRAAKAVRQQIAADFLDSLQLGLERAQVTRGFGDDLRALLAIQTELRRQIALQGATVELQRQLFQTQEQMKDLRRQQLADLLDFLQLRVEKAQATPGFADDIKALKAVQAALKQQIREQGHTVELERQLFEAQQQLREAQLARRNARQFRALGLGPTGDEPIPGVKGLKKQLARISDAVKGTFLDTGKTRSLLQSIRRLLAGQLGALSREVRQKIAELLAGIDQQLRAHEGGPQSHRTRFKIVDTDKLLAGLGLTPEQIKALRARLSQRGPGGTAPAGGHAALGFATGGSTASGRGGASSGGGGTGGGKGDVIVRGDLVLVGVHDTDQLVERLRKHRRRKGAGQRGGRHGGRDI